MTQTEPSHLITRNNYLPSLDGCRGLAVLFIVIYHSFRMFWPGNFISWGYLDIDFFFILSGFILSRRYAGLIRNREMGFRIFALRRFSRLYPVYIVCFLTVVALNEFGMDVLGKSSVYNWHYFWRDAFWQLLLLQCIGGQLLSWLSVSWSISVEWVVNLFFFIVHRFRMAPVYVWTIAIGCILKLIMHGYLNAMWVHLPLFNLPVVRGIAGFSIGVFLFQMHTKLPPLSTRNLHILEIVLLVPMIGCAYFHRHPGFIDLPFLLVFFPALLTLTLYQDSWLNAFFSRKLLMVLGTISYSIYLWQEPVSISLRMFNLDAVLPAPAQGLMYVSILLAVAGASYTYLEKPSRRLISKYGA